jgi:hypothetical protein
VNPSQNEEYPGRWEPNPCDFAGEDAQGVYTEKLSDADRGHGNRPNWEEIPRGIERRKECHTKSSVSQCIEYSV